MYQSGRRLFSAYLVLPTGSGEARREANGRETRNWASGVALSHATLHDSLTDWSQSSLAPQHGGGRGVVNAGALCRGTVNFWQAYVGSGWYSAVPGAPAWKWSIPYAGRPVECCAMINCIIFFSAANAATPWDLRRVCLKTCFAPNLQNSVIFLISNRHFSSVVIKANLTMFCICSRCHLRTVLLTITNWVCQKWLISQKTLAYNCFTDPIKLPTGASTSTEYKQLLNQEQPQKPPQVWWGRVTRITSCEKRPKC